MTEKTIKPSNKRNLSGHMLVIRDGMAILTAIYMIIAAMVNINDIFHKSFSFGLFFAIIFISYRGIRSSNSNRVSIVDIVLAIASLFVTLYMTLNLGRLVRRIGFVDPVTTLDIFFCILTVVLLLEGTRRVIGPWLSGLCLLAIAYMSFGQHIPGRFGHMGFSIQYITDGLFLSTYGIWGSTIGIATGHIMVFLIFGAFFLKSGAGNFLFDFASAVAGTSQGGVAKIAVVSSSLFGMISGGPLSNVTTTGTITIPAMKEKGYSPEFAAAVESCASTGGIFMPPVMGSVAFVMSETVGIPYGEIARRALLPAVLYFCALFFIIDFRSRRLSIDKGIKGEIKPILPILIRGVSFYLPLAYMVFRLSSGMSPSRIGLETIVVIMLVNLCLDRSLFELSVLGHVLKTAVGRGVIVLSTMATCGILVGIINITGISAKFSSYLMSMASFSVLATLVLVMGITLFLGLAMNITSAYLITAVICAPILIRLGFLPLSVHMFILFFSTMATITPPVALTAFAAATIADAAPMKVGFYAMRMGMVAYVLPYIFLFKPAILMYGSMMEISFVFLSSIFGVMLLAGVIEGRWFHLEVSSLTRVILLIASVLALSGNPILVGLSGLMLIGSILLKNRSLKLSNTQKEVSVKNEENKSFSGHSIGSMSDADSLQ